MADVDRTNWIPGTRYFTQVTSDDHTAWLYIITLLSLCYMAIVFVIRFVVKFGMYGHDDWALLVSTILASAQHLALFAGIAKGMGRSTALLSQAAIDTIESVSRLVEKDDRFVADGKAVCGNARLPLHPLALCVKVFDRAFDATSLLEWSCSQQVLLLGAAWRIHCLRLMGDSGTCCRMSFTRICAASIRSM